MEGCLTGCGITSNYHQFGCPNAFEPNYESVPVVPAGTGSYIAHTYFAECSDCGKTVNQKTDSTGTIHYRHDCKVKP